MEHFEQIGTRGFYRPQCRVSFEQAVEMVARAMVHARESGCHDLLVNTYGFSGLESPDVFARYNLAVRWAESAGSKLRVALAAPSELIDPEKIAITMAHNRGAMGDVFTNEAAAIAWLNARQVMPR
jgi:hypothetical protein